MKAYTQVSISSEKKGLLFISSVQEHIINRAKQRYSYNIKITKCIGRCANVIVYSYFMPVCSIDKTITPRCCGRPDALLHEAEGYTILQTGIK